MDLDPSARDEYRRRLWDIDYRSLQQDPLFWRVQDADAPETGDVVTILSELGSQRNISPGVLIAAGERLTEAGQHKEALRLFELARGRDAERATSNLYADAWYVRRIAQARWSAGGERQAIMEFASPWACVGDGNWRTAVVDALLQTTSLETEEGFRLLHSWLLREAGNAPDDAADALDTLFEERYAPLVRGRDGSSVGEALPPPPIVLELDPPLYVQDAVQDELPENLKQLRHDIRRRTGVTLAPIPILPAGWLGSPTGDSFRLFILDDLVVEGQAVAEQLQPTAIKSALTPPLLAHLYRLFDLDAAATMVEEWQKDGPARAVASRVLDDDIALLQFTRVVRRLLAEQVPVHGIGALIEEIAAAAPESTADEIAARVRRRLRRPLTELVLGAGATEPPDAALSILKVARAGGRRLTPFEAMLVREALRAQLAGNGSQPPALLVDDAELRKTLDSLARRECPNVLVVERQELVGEPGSGAAP
jgi:hypothetical protein